MNKSDLRNIGLFLITPFPQKLHYEGVDNVRAARQLTLIGVLIMIATPVLAFLGAKVMNEIDERRINKSIERTEG